MRRSAVASGLGAVLVMIGAMGACGTSAPPAEGSVSGTRGLSPGPAEQEEPDIGPRGIDAREWAADTGGEVLVVERVADARCDPNYAGGCVPIDVDVDCAGGSGNGPSFVAGPVRVVGRDQYGLDRDHDGIGCDR